MLLNDFEKEDIVNSIYKWVTINGKQYYVKVADTELDGTELVMEKLAKEVGINVAHYERCVIDDEIYLLSESIAPNDSEYEFNTIEEVINHGLNNFGIATGSLYNIWHLLEVLYPNDIEFLMHEIVKIYLFDLIMLNIDRNFSNYGILYKNNKPFKVYILDNEYSFTSRPSAVLESRLEWFNRPIQEIEEQNMDNFKYFLDTSSQKFLEIAYKMFADLNPETVRYYIEMVEDIIGNGYKFPENLYLTYLTNYERIGSLIANKRWK